MATSIDTIYFVTHRDAKRGHLTLIGDGFDCRLIAEKELEGIACYDDAPRDRGAAQERGGAC